MKFFFTLFISVVFLFSCHSNTEEKVNDPVAPTTTAEPVKPDSLTSKLYDTISNIEKIELSLGGYKVQSMSITQLKWEPASIKDFYLTRKTNMEKDRLSQQQIYLKLKKDGVVQNAGKIQDDSIKNVKAMQTLTSLYEHADTTKKLYLVTYHMTAKTNMASYDGMYSKYLSAKDLKEVRISFNSVF